VKAPSKAGNQQIGKLDRQRERFWRRPGFLGPRVDLAVGWMGCLIRWRFAEGLNHRSVAQACTPNSRRRKTDDIARPHPRSSTCMPGRKSRASANHSVIHRGLAAPLSPASTHSGW
jgi:hypothetical protein